MSTWRARIRRFLGLVLNSIGFIFTGLLAVLDAAGTLDWNSIIGPDLGKFVIPGAFLLNIFLRAVVTRTKGSPNDPIVS